MTTIATDGVTIAADSRMCSFMRGNIDPFICKGSYKKLYIVPQGIFGIAGSDDQTQVIVEWLNDGGKRGERPRVRGGQWEALLLTKHRIINFDGTLDKLVVRPPTAIGSGSHFALGAMYAGSDPLKAVQIARSLDPYTGGKIIHLGL